MLVTLRNVCNPFHNGEKIFCQKVIENNILEASGLREQDLVGIKLKPLRSIMKNVEGWSQPRRGILTVFKIASK